MRLENFGDAGHCNEMVEAIPLVWNEQEIPSLHIEERCNLLQMMDQAGLMLDAVGTDDRPELAIDDTEVSDRRDIMDVRGGDIRVADALRTFIQLLLIEHVEVEDVLSRYTWLTKRTDFENGRIFHCLCDQGFPYGAGACLPAFRNAKCSPMLLKLPVGEAGKITVFGALIARIEFYGKLFLRHDCTPVVLPRISK